MHDRLLGIIEVPWALLSIITAELCWYSTDKLRALALVKGNS
jgi:hypothetical protein